MKEATINVKAKPWQTPNFVQIDVPHANDVSCPAIAIKEVPAELLGQMCDNYRAEVFDKAGKDDPGTGEGPTLAAAINRIQKHMQHGAIKWAEVSREGDITFHATTGYPEHRTKS